MENTTITWLLAEAGVKALIISQIVLVLAALEVYIERRVAAFIQNRIGPNRVGPFGLLQPFADVVKQAKAALPARLSIRSGYSSSSSSTYSRSAKHGGWRKHGLSGLSVAR